MSHHTAQILRQRARRLRQLATEITRTHVLSLHQHAGDETWRGARPQFCVNLLRSHQSRLHNDAHDLLMQASLLEQRAAEVEHLAVLQQSHAR